MTRKQSGSGDPETVLYEYSLRALGRRMRSVAELKRLLRSRCPEAAVVDRVIARLKEQKYLNDTNFAAAYSSYRKDNQKFGPRRVITDLKIKGVHKDVIAQAVTEAYRGVDEEGLARAYLRRKRMDAPENQTQAARVFRALMRAGFTSRVILTILRDWNEDDAIAGALEDFADANRES